MYKTLEDFDFTFNPQIPKSKIADIATCNFIERKENVLLAERDGKVAKVLAAVGDTLAVDQPILEFEQ